MKTRTAAAVASLAAAVALAACGGGGGSSSSSTAASVTAFCDKAREFRQVQSSFSGLSSISEARTAFHQALQKLQAVADAAPAAVKSSADKAVSIFHDLDSAVEGASSPQDLQSKLQGLASEVNGLQSSINDLKSFFKDNCKQ
jgi:hypothetical protein